MEMQEQEMITFIKDNIRKSPEEMKKALRQRYPELKISNQEMEKYIIKAMAKHRQEKQAENRMREEISKGFER